MKGQGVFRNLCQFDAGTAQKKATQDLTGRHQDKGSQF